tara:strand:- start:340 stop:792 length:453 start_codon:yes stop_codon:yes gene_type:complete
MSKSPNTVESLISVASRLIVLLEKEVTLLRAMKPRALADLQEEKMRLVIAYEEQVRNLSASPDALKDVAPVLRDEFAAIATRFDAALTENRRALTGVSEAQRRFFEAVVKAAEEKRTNHQGYSADGSRPAPGYGRPTRQGPLSLTLDRQF